MAIDAAHPQYLDMAERWQRCRDVASGSDAVKAGGTKYLPCPPGMRAFDGYPAYVTRASFFNAMSRTIDGLGGAIFSKEPDITVPSKIKAAWLDNITLADMTLKMLALHVVREVLTVGRALVLVDYSKAASRPYMAVYPAESLVSWQSERRGGDSTLVRAVLREHVEGPDPNDENKITSNEQYRELVLPPSGEYKSRVHVRLPRAHLRDQSKTVWVASEWVTPGRLGDPFPFIPLTIFGASRLGPGVDRPPLIDLVDVNLSHYRSSADREHSLFYVSQPTPWVAGAKGDGPLLIGSSVAWNLEADGRAGMLEHSGEGIGAIKDVMNEKAAQMASLGARLLEEQPRVAETATAVQMRHGGEQASLRTIASVVETGLTQALRRFVWWQGEGGKVSTPEDVDAAITLNKDFMSMKLTADELRSIVLAWQADGISWETLHHNLTRGDLMRPDVSIEDERQAIRVGGGGLPAPLDVGDE